MVKFGKQMRAVVEGRMPQWRDYCLSYKRLKQFIKQAQTGTMSGGARLPGCHTRERAGGLGVRATERGDQTP